MSTPSWVELPPQQRAAGRSGAAQDIFRKTPGERQRHQQEQRRQDGQDEGLVEEKQLRTGAQECQGDPAQSVTLSHVVGKMTQSCARMSISTARNYTCTEKSVRLPDRFGGKTSTLNKAV